MTIFEVVMRLTGPIAATGNRGLDLKRLENLNQAIRVADLLLGEIAYVASSDFVPAASMRSIGERAKTFLDGVRKGNF